MKSCHGFCDAAVTAVLNDLRNKQSILQCHENQGNPACLVIRERSILQALFAQMVEKYEQLGPVYLVISESDCTCRCW